MISNFKITFQLMSEKIELVDALSLSPVMALRLFHKYEQHCHNKRTGEEEAIDGLLEANPAQEAAGQSNSLSFLTFPKFSMEQHLDEKFLFMESGEMQKIYR
jgi:hypothetical protein